MGDPGKHVAAERELAPSTEHERAPLGRDAGVGALIQRFDWGNTPLGAASGWSPSLRSTVSLCLESRFPFCIAWGESRTQIYNEGYLSICGAKHPAALGQDFRSCWASAWPVLGEAFERAWAGESSYIEDRRLFLDRHGALEEVFLTYSFSPIRDETGRVCGVLHPVTETTSRVLGARRSRLLRDLVAATAGARSAGEALRLAVVMLRDAALDVPFVALYSLGTGAHEARLTARTPERGIEACTPEAIALSPESPGREPWPLSEVLASGKGQRVEDLAARFGRIACGPYAEPPRAALALPIAPHGSGEPLAVLIAATSPRLPLTDEYRAFYDLLAEAVTTCVENALAHERQRRRAEQLAELDRAKMDFFSNVSHEFRTPLTLLAVPLEDELAEREQPLPPARRQRLELALRSSRRLLKLVNTLLEFSRIEAGRAVAKYQPTELSTFTSELVSMFRSALERAGLELRLELEPPPEPVYVDRDMWEKIVLNLMSNAFKHTFQGGIEVRLRAAGEMLELSVADTGIGIAESELSRLFERFHRVQGAESRSHEGTGIGLALVRELSRLHGGDVRAVSQLGVGSTFTVAIRRGRAHLPPEQVDADASPPMTGADVSAYVHEALQWSAPAAVQEPDSGQSVTGIRSKRDLGLGDRATILLVDDNADMRDYVSRLLAQSYEVIAVADGQAALEQVKRAPPQLVLTDVMMPRVDGFQLLRALRAEPRLQNLPVILLSARAGEDSAVEGLDAGADDYLVKPFSARELFARVRTHLELSRVRRGWAEHLEQANQELEAFSYSVSHDLRTPLRAIDGFSQAILSRKAHLLDDEARGYLTRVRAAAGRMGELIDELLNLARVSRATIRRRAVALSELVRSVAAAVRERYPGHHVELDVQDELLAYADRNLLQIALENLLDNGFKFTARRPDARLRIGQLPGAAPPTYFIEDNGAGFDAAYAHRLFQPFQRLHTERDFHGTGIGLAIVHRIVTRHGGRVWAEGRENQGATFYFTLTQTP